MADEDLRPTLQGGKVVLRNLEALLKGKFGNSLVVDSFTTTDLLASGENYASTMLKVDAVVRRDGENSKPEELFLVAKMVPPKEFQKVPFNSPLSFEKEIYMFEVIIRAYKDLERECGVPEVQVFDLLPNFYGARLSLEEAEEKFDDDAVILMDNLKAKNYVCANRNVGCDLAHARMVVMALARFHALGIAVKFKKPELFEKLKIYAKPVTTSNEIFESSKEFVLGTLRKNSVLLPHLPRVERALLGSSSDYCKLNALFEPWVTITHADLWMNNVMFRHDVSGNPEDVKFVDFQEYMYFNPMRDLIDFLFTSCGKEVRTTHIEDLCDLYYEQLVSHLTRLQCNVKSFPKHSFDEQLAVAAKFEYVRCMCLSKVVTADAETDPVDDPLHFFQVPSSEKCALQMAEITLIFINKNWI